MLVRKGDKGNNVGEIQTWLNTAQGESLRTDGNFGALTEAAVKRFQAKQGLREDGIWGDNTQKAAERLGLILLSQPDGLTDADFQRAADRLGCDLATVKAVKEVESKGKAFYSNGFPVILFERHKFRKYTNGKYNKTHPHLSGPAGGYGATGQNQINKFNEAFALAPEAAMKSCSWGMFQIMGFNHEACGYASVGEFVDAMKESEAKQLDAFVSFVIHEHLADELRRHDWDGFALGYNGEEYRRNRYDTKLADAHRRFSA